MPFVPDATPGFVPDKPVAKATPGFVPDSSTKMGSTAGFVPDKPIGRSLLKKGLEVAKSYAFGKLPFEATKSAYNLASKIDAPIEKFRSETLPTAIEKAAPSLLSTVTETGERKPLSAEQVRPLTSLAIPTTKEVAAGGLLGMVAKPLARAATPIAEKFIPGLAERNLVKREVAALGRIQQSNLSQPVIASGQILKTAEQRFKEASKDFLAPAKREADGTVKQVWFHQEFTPEGKPIHSAAENGFIDSSGKFYSIKDISKAAKGGDLSILNRIKNTGTTSALRRQFIHEETEKFVKESVGNLNLETKGLPAAQSRSFTNSVNDYLSTEEGALRNQGVNGKLLANDALHYSRDSQIMAAKAQTKILPDILSLPEDVRKLIPDYLEPRPGSQRPILAGRAKEVAENVQRQLKVWGRFLEKQDITVVRKGEETKFFAKNQFFPRSLDTDLLASNPAAYQSELQHLVSSKQVRSAEEAKQVLDAAIATKSNIFSPQDFTNFYGSKKVSTIERPRVYTFKNVTNDPVENLVNYFNSVARRVNEIKYFGQSGELLHQRLAAIGNEGGNANLAQGIMSRLLRQTAEDSTGDIIVKNLRAFQGATKLGLSAIPNLQQGVVNSYVRSQSEAAVSKGFLKSFSKEGVDFARRAGVVGNKEVDEYMDAIAGMSPDARSSVEKAANFVGKISGFKKSEELNRIQAANIGREYVNELAEKFLKTQSAKVGRKTVEKELQDFGIDTAGLLKRGKLTANEELKAANTFVGETQFGTKPLGMPTVYSAGGPVGKVMGQFSMFPVQQGRLVAKAAAQHPLKTGPIVAGTAVTIGGALNAAGNLARGRAPIEKKKTPQATIVNYVLSSILSSGALGKVGGVIGGLPYGVESVASQMVGPTIMDASRGIYNAGQAVKGNPKPLVKQALQEIPIVGRGIANVLLPSAKKRK